jgi:uncharacterized protein (DUF1684 family)
MTMTNINEFRKEKDEFFLHSHHSPLTDYQRHDFAGLKYFPENPDLDLELDLIEFDEVNQVQMQTTTGDVQTYDRYARVQFEVEGEPAELTIYANEHGYFLPFVDSLAGDETYGAGRYLEPTQLPDGKVHIDFNLAYNPYCAYNERWSCPITPGENRLKMPIRAGEMVYDEHF